MAPPLAEEKGVKVAVGLSVEQRYNAACQSVVQVSLRLDARSVASSDAHLAASLADAFPLHRAVREGHLHTVRHLFAASHLNFPANEPDDLGRSAVFFAQLQGRADLVHELVSRGWTPMPEGNLYRGAGGRLCFWNDANPGVRAAPCGVAWRHCGGSAPPVRVVRDTDKHKDAIRFRRAEARLRFGLTDNSVGKVHRLYARKEYGSSRSRTRHARPHLNVRDCAEGHATPRDMVQAALHLDEAGSGGSDEGELEDALLLEATETVARTVEATRTATRTAARTLESVARFVLDRRPTRAADGQWVVLESSLLADELVVVPSREEDVISLASYASAADDGAWPSLPEAMPAAMLADARAPAAGAREREALATVAEPKGGEVLDGEEFGEVDDDEWERLSDGPSPSPVSPTSLAAAEALKKAAAPRHCVAPRTAAWRGAAATHAAIGLDKMVQGGTVRFAEARCAIRGNGTSDPQTGHHGTQQENSPPAAQPQLPRRQADDDDDASTQSTMDATAGLKDASHRTYGARSASLKLVEKRSAAVAKRAAQRERQRS